MQEACKGHLLAHDNSPAKAVACFVCIDFQPEKVFALLGSSLMTWFTHWFEMQVPAQAQWRRKKGCLSQS